MGVQVSALTKCHIKWGMTVPTAVNTNNKVHRWDALIDTYLHNTQTPSAATNPITDIQIMQTLSDQPLAGQPANQSGFWASSLATSHGFLKTIGGVQYAMAIDMSGTSSFVAAGGHVMTLFPTPTSWSSSSGISGTFWGQQNLVHDMDQIIAYFNSSNPTDDNGTPIKNAAGTTITSPLIASTQFLTAVNAGYELDFGSAGNFTWTTNSFGVAMQNEPDNF